MNRPEPEVWIILEPEDEETEKLLLAEIAELVEAGVLVNTSASPPLAEVHGVVNVKGSGA